MSNAVTQDGAGVASGMLGGIASALGIRQLTAREARLEKDNHILKEENKLLRTEYDDLQTDAFRFHRENLRLQETLQAKSLEVKALTERYEEAKSLSEKRFKRLLAVQVLASEADSQSTSDLIQKVESFNEDTVLQNTADGEAEIQDGADPLPTTSPATTTSEFETNALSEVDHIPGGIGIVNLEKDVERLRTEYSGLQMAARKYHRDAFRVHQENQRLTINLEAMSLEIKRVTKRYEEAKMLSETRGKELIGAQVFLTKADGLSISELVQKVDDLNDEIYQVAASLGKSIIQKQVEPSDKAHYSPEESATAKALLGSPLCKVLRTSARKIEINPLLVQIALQTFFAMFCIQRIRSWIPSHLGFDAALRELYEKIWTSSDQAVSGRWRSLARAQLKIDTNTWIKEVLTDLDAILALASWDICSPEDRHTLEACLPAIFKVVLDVREAIGEKFTSADIEVSYVEPNSPFSGIYMEESYADSEGPEKEIEIVIATVGMGVRKVVILKDGRGHEYVLRPKVVLESNLMAVLEPPPPRPTRSKLTRRS